MDSRCTAQVVSTIDDSTTGSRRASWGLVYNIISTVETGGDAQKTVGDSSRRKATTGSQVFKYRTAASGGHE